MGAYDKIASPPPNTSVRDATSSKTRFESRPTYYDLSRLAILKGFPMFGKPDWFYASTRWCSLKPKGWRGRAYLSAWAGAILIPGLLLATRGQWLESVVWGAVSVVAAGWDLRNVMKQRRAQAAFDDLLYIGDQPHETAATDNYELQLRR